MSSDPQELKHQLNMRVSEAWLEKIDDWRGSRRPIPDRSAAIRMLVELGLAAPKAKSKGKSRP